MLAEFYKHYRGRQPPMLVQEMYLVLSGRSDIEAAKVSNEQAVTWLSDHFGADWKSPAEESEDIPEGSVDLEALAAQEHVSWAGWTRWMLGEIEKELDDACTNLEYTIIDLDDFGCVKRWKRQMATPYADLSEEEKESDRQVVRSKLALYMCRENPHLPEDYKAVLEASQHTPESGEPITDDPTEAL